MKKTLPIGIDSFSKLRETNRYYIDKTLLVRDFIETADEVALITRPRRFGKTLNMTMLREFFDITKDSREIFDGLKIMETEYAAQINSRPVICFTFKDCKANTVEDLLFFVGNVILYEYEKYNQIFKGNVDDSKACYFRFFDIYKKLVTGNIELRYLMISIITLEQALYEYYRIRPILLIDEYDQPIMSSFECGFHDQLKNFFAGFYGAALKGQECLHQALLTGIQRIVKESIFSQLNNIVVYTVLDKQYSTYFGLTTEETEELLNYYGMTLDEETKRKYDGYLFGETEIYNPWSLIYYAKSGELKNYWINTSTNYLIKKLISEADDLFKKSFETLISDGVVEVAVNLECSFIELKNQYTLWGLLINSGYLTAFEQADESSVIEHAGENAMIDQTSESPMSAFEQTSGRYVSVRIPNGEVLSEFALIVAERANVRIEGLHMMFRYLFARNMEDFMKVYSELVISCTSYFDAKENAYHMLFLGMCVSLNSIYKTTSNIESGYGRSDIIMESLSVMNRPHIVIEFKQGEAIDELKEEALRQIIDNQYYSSLHGDILCIGIAHNKKKCAMAHKTILN